MQGIARQSNRLYSRFPHYDFQYAEDPILKESIQGLSIQQIEDLEYGGIALGRIVLPSLRWVLRRHHLFDNETTRYLYREFILSAWNVYAKFDEVLNKVVPQAIVVFNGQFFSEAVVKYLARQKGIRVILHEVAMQPLSCFFSDGEATAYPIHIPPDFKLSEEQNKKLDGYLEQRFQGNFTMSGIQFWHRMSGLSADFLELASNFKQVVPIFTNVIFDTSQGHANFIFSDMFEWLDFLVKIIKHHPETLFVIRAHPDEDRKGKESDESVAEWVKRNGVNQLKNVVFVDSSDPFSSYDLIQRSKFVMVYNSTIGLEASVIGAPVLCAGKARFTQLPTVFLPGNVREYKNGGTISD